MFWTRVEESLCDQMCCKLKEVPQFMIFCPLCSTCLNTGSLIGCIYSFTIVHLFHMDETYKGFIHEQGKNDIPLNMLHTYCKGTH